MGFSIGKLFAAITGQKSPAQKADAFLEGGSIPTQFEQAATGNLTLGAASMLSLAKTLRNADPSKLSPEARAQVQDSLRSFAQGWKAKAPAEFTLRTEPAITDRKTGAVKGWTRPFDSVLTPEGDLSPQSWSAALQYVVNDAPAKFGVTGLEQLGKLSVQLSPVQGDAFDPPNGSAPRPSDLRVAVQFR